MVERFKVTLPALTGDRERTAYVYLPKDYESGERYPVIYMFDGHNLFCDEEATFGKCWGLEKYMDETGTKAIIAAVECNHEGNMRLSEYSPVDFDFHGEKIKGRGKKYMDWLTGVFKPYIDENYPTLKNRENTFIAGSSMGGLMSLYAVAKYGKIFGGAAALSPSLWVENGEVPKFIENAKFQKDCVVYADYGSREFKNHSVQRKVFAQTCALLVERGVYVTSRIVPMGIHSEASWEKQIPLFMRVLSDMPRTRK